MSTASYKKFVDIIGVTIAAIGVPLFFFGQFQEVKRERINRTLDYVEEYSRGEIYQVRRDIFEIWSSFPVGYLSDLKANNAVWNKLVSDIAATNPSFTEAVIDLVAFFDTVGNCVSVGECHAATATDLISNQAVIFCDLYGPLVASISSQSALSSFGDGLQVLVDLTQTETACSATQSI